MRLARQALAMQSGRAWPVLLLLVALTAAYAWWYFAPDTIPDVVRKQLPISARGNPVLYRWRDDHGHPHVTDAPPTDRPYETLKYDPKTNVVPSIVPPPPPEKP
jgi:Domain of unknown function (DUF4124)